MLEEMTKCSSGSTTHQFMATHLSVCPGRVACRVAAFI